MAFGDFFKNLFGSSKEKVAEVADTVEHLVQENYEKAKEVATPIIEKAETFAEETLEKVKEVATPIIEKAETFAHETLETVKEKVNSFTNDTSEDADEIRTKAEDTVKPADENAD